MFKPRGYESKNIYTSYLSMIKKILNPTVALKCLCIYMEVCAYIRQQFWHNNLSF